MAMRKIWALWAVAAALGVAIPAPARASVPSELDIAFLVVAHQSYLTEVAAGEQAETRASSQEVRGLGTRTAAGYRQLDLALQQVARAANVPLPVTPGEEQRAEADRLAVASPPDYDALWLSARLDAHRQAMANVRHISENGDDPATRQLARDALPAIAAFQEQVESAARDLGVAALAEGAAPAPDDSTNRTTVLLVAGLVVLVVLVGGGLALSGTRR